MKLLIIEDNQELVLTLKEKLESLYTIELATTGRRGLLLANRGHNDLIILDLGLPDVDGKTVCQQIRAKDNATPILILTAQSEIEDKVALLDMGADDYLLKPFQFPELLARIRALVRRTDTKITAKILSYGDLTVNLEDRLVMRAGQTINLRRKEFDILEYFLLNRGRLVTRQMLLHHVWNVNSEPFDNTVDVHIKYLRDQIDKPFAVKLIKTVHGLGYRFGSEPDTAPEGR